jgi:hypothetical protein
LGIRAAGLIYVSGQAGIDGYGRTVSDDLSPAWPNPSGWSKSTP